MLTDTQQDRLDEVAACAVQSETSTGAPAEVTVAQWATESAWGSKYVAHCNPFGIKAYPGADRELAATSEWFTPSALAAFLARDDHRTAVLTSKGQGAKDRYAIHDWFAAYPGLASAFRYHGHLITTGLYADAFTEYQHSGDMARYIRGMAAHYATDPAYARTLLAIIQMPAVQQALHDARHETV